MTSSSATLTTFESAIGLAKQAVHQDKSKNYSEAARCYREAIDTFHVVKTKSGNVTVSHAIDEKISQYRDRLARIEKYLLSKADLSQLFKAVVVEQHSLLLQNNNLEKTDSDENSHKTSSQLINVDKDICIESVLQQGLASIEKAKRKDGKRDCHCALKFMRMECETCWKWLCKSKPVIQKQLTK